MDIDIEKIANQILSKLTGNSDLLNSFKKDPVGTIKNTLGIDIPEDQIKSVISLVTSKLGSEAASSGLAGILDKVKSLFGK